MSMQAEGSMPVRRISKIIYHDYKKKSSNFVDWGSENIIYFFIMLNNKKIIFVDSILKSKQFQTKTVIPIKWPIQLSFVNKSGTHVTKKLTITLCSVYSV